MACGPGNAGKPDQGALLAHRSDEEACRDRRPGNVPGRRAAKGGQLDHGDVPEGGRGLPEGRLPIRNRSRRDHRQRRYRRRDLPVVRRRTRQRQGRYHRQDRCGSPGARILQEADRRPAAGRAVLGRCLEQQMADLGPRGADPESAERLGGRQARRAAGRRTMLDARLPVRSKGPFCALPALFLGPLDFSKNKERPRACSFICHSRHRSRSSSRRAAGTICRPMRR